MRLNPGLIVLAVACVCTACATPRSYAPDTAGETRRLKIGAGDEIRVVTTNRAARFAGNLFLILGGGYMDDGGHAALNSADQRIGYLLRLKRARGCPASATSEPGMTDLQMLDVLEPLMPPTGTPDRQALDRRTSLLDHLRAPLPVPPESGSRTP